MRERQGAPAARELCVVYLLLIIYATLHPITSWRAAPAPPWAWLTHWPGIILPFDVVFNILAYVPLGMLLVLAFHPRLRALPALLLAALIGAALSLLLESLQTYLPSRTPSLVDLATNSAGALIGALLALPLLPLIDSDLLRRLGAAWLLPGRSAGRALILAGLWLFALLFPESILFGHGSALAYLSAPLSGYPFTPAEFARVETAVTASSLFAAGVLLLCALAPRAPRVACLTVLIACACVLRSLSQAILFGPDAAWLWLTPGALRGLAAGAAALIATLALTRAMRLAVLMIAVTFATVVVNIAPPNPYYLSAVQQINPGRFLDFNGLTQLVAALWPFLALLYALSALTESAQA
ncbi:MAG TPA: VanZ family protein [Burkholderiales bacterium]|jgi:VanZ family protein